MSEFSPSADIKLSSFSSFMITLFQMRVNLFTSSINIPKEVKIRTQGFLFLK